MTTVGAPVPAASITVGDPPMRFPLPKADAVAAGEDGSSGGA